jgi:hypothetical protein
MTFDPPEDRSPAAVTGLIEFVFGEIWSRPVLSRRDRRFVTLACVAAADAEQPLREHVYAALNSGDLTIVEIAEREELPVDTRQHRSRLQRRARAEHVHILHHQAGGVLESALRRLERNRRRAP